MSYFNSSIKRSKKSSFKKEIKYFIDKKKYTTALEKIDEYLDSYPKDTYASVCKAIIYKEQGKEDMASSLFESLIIKQTHDKQMKVMVYKEYGKFLASLKRNDEAIEYFNLAIEESDENEVDTRLALSRLYSYRKDLDNAIKCMTIEGTNNDYLSVKRAELYFNNRKYDKALEELDNVERKRIRNEFVRQEYDYLYGAMYHQTGNFKKARGYLENCANVKNTHYYNEALARLAMIDLLYDDVAEAMLKCKLIINNDSAPYSTKNRAICTLGNAYLKICDYDNARECYNMLPDKFSRKLLEIGRLNLYTNNLEEAESSLENFITDIDIDHYEALYYLALTKFRLGKYDEASKITYDVLSVAAQENKKNELHQIRKDLKRLKLIIEMVTNTPIRQSSSKSSYVEKQIMSYSKDAAIDHIKSHHVDNARISKFDDDIVIEDLIDRVKESLDEKNKMSYEVLDKYIINLKDINYECKNPINIFVLTIPNTKNIVNMYPNYINITNDDEKETSSKKVKRLSQIEKFNMKYKK